eukprot:CAMPEP_0176450422 /NCGR_PEP_ID=MMETSP0127-20121128/27139_1 /TAXON_ID=938130 /ORGANISM="Platyophrya macrostoma, Strain WH" /LENGTH=161 /DNA_ID=CAMNT_0017838099 /DNA_START=9 /DNA_END=494 /DNA_ORIENTATION=-
MVSKSKQLRQSSTPSEVVQSESKLSTFPSAGTSSSRGKSVSSGSWDFFFFAMLAGVFGALSGVTGKVSVAGELTSLVIFRVASFAANGFCTAQMWRYYLKALALGSTPTCQIINTGTNFMVSAIMGMLLFGESVNTLWCCGAVLIVVGLGIITADPSVKIE